MKWLDSALAQLGLERRSVRQARATLEASLPPRRRPLTFDELTARNDAVFTAHGLERTFTLPLTPPNPIQPVRPADAPKTSAPTTESPQMSDIDKLAKGELTVPAFVTKVVGEINANAGLKAAASFVLMLLAPTIEKALGSSTVATSIVQDIEAGLSGQSLSAGLAGLGV